MLARVLFSMIPKYKRVQLERSATAIIVNNPSLDVRLQYIVELLENGRDDGTIDHGLHFESAGIYLLNEDGSASLRKGFGDLAERLESSDPILGYKGRIKLNREAMQGKKQTEIVIHD